MSRALALGWHAWSFACAFVAAIALCLLCSLASSILAARAVEDRSPTSFLQMRLAIQRPGTSQACPEKLLQWYPDCRVISAKADFTVGATRPKDQKESLLLYNALQLPFKELSMVGWDPVVEEVASTCEENSKVSLVHHINVFSASGGEVLEPGKIYSKEGFHSLQLDESSLRMLASHDKMAGQYLLPKGYGIPLPQQALLEHHILFPRCWVFGTDVHFSSGFKLYATAGAQNPAALIGALNYNMDVQPSQGSVEWVTRISADNLMGVVQPKAHEWPEIVAVHLHTHDVAHSKFFEVENADGSVAFRSQQEAAGYGLKEQSFWNLADIGWPRLRLRAGQQLSQHCLIDSDHLSEPVRYGLNSGEEMCAPLLLLGGTGLRLGSTLLSTDDGFLQLARRQLKAWLGEVLYDAGRVFQELRTRPSQLSP